MWRPGRSSGQAVKDEVDVKSKAHANLEVVLTLSLDGVK